MSNCFEAAKKLRRLICRRGTLLSRNSASDGVTLECLRDIGHGSKYDSKTWRVNRHSFSLLRIVLALKFLYYLVGKKATLVFVSDDISILAYMKVKGD
jgi:hypothetical protein